MDKSQPLGRIIKQALFLALLFFTVAGCAYCKVPANTSTPVCKVAKVAKQCGAPEVVKLIAAYLPEVVVDLLSGNYAALLTDLEARLAALGADGSTVVACAVAVADANTSPPPGSAMLPQLIPLHEHAQSWLTTHPVK